MNYSLLRSIILIPPRYISRWPLPCFRRPVKLLSGRESLTVNPNFFFYTVLPTLFSRRRMRMIINLWRPDGRKKEKKMEFELTWDGSGNGGGFKKIKVARKETPTDSEIKRRPNGRTVVRLCPAGRRPCHVGRNVTIKWRPPLTSPLLIVSF